MAKYKFWQQKFKIISLSRALSIFGDQFLILAIGWWTLRETNDPIDVSIITVSVTLCKILLAPIVGTFGDRYNKIRLLIFSHTIELIGSLTLGLMILFDHFSILHITMILIFSTLGSTIAKPISKGLIPFIVPKSKLRISYSKSQILYTIASLGGLTIAGLVINFVGLEYALFIDALTFLIAGILFSRIELKYRKQPYHKGLTLFKAWLYDVREGARSMKANHLILKISILIMVVNVAISPCSLCINYFVQNSIKGGSYDLGIINACFGGGFILGGLLMKRLHSNIGILSIGLLIMVIGSWAIAFSNSTPLISLSVAILGIGASVASIIFETKLFGIIPKKHLTKILSFQDTIIQLAVPGGLLMGALCLDYFGITVTILISSIFLLTVLFIVRFNKKFLSEW